MANFTTTLFILVVMAAVLAVHRATAMPSCSQETVMQFQPDPSSCQAFYVCMQGRLLRYTCSPRSAYNPSMQACIPAMSIFDTCSRSRGALPGTVCGPHSQSVTPHPEHCALYYNCSLGPQEQQWEEGLRECPYPQLFDSQSLSCRHYSQVKCGSRQEPIDQCDYRVNQCGNSNCVPCEVRFPSCRGLPDGLHPWQGRPRSPYYVACSDQRVKEQSMCPQEGMTQIFDPEIRECVQLEGDNY